VTPGDSWLRSRPLQFDTHSAGKSATDEPQLARMQVWCVYHKVMNCSQAGRHTHTHAEERGRIPYRIKMRSHTHLLTHSPWWCHRARRCVWIFRV
jgi:hypothetical protein